MALSPGHAPPAALGNVDADAVGTVLRDLRLAGALASARRATPAVSRGVSLVAPVCSIRSVHASTVSTRKPLWCIPLHSAPCASKSESSCFVQARIVTYKSPSLWEMGVLPPCPTSAIPDTSVEKDATCSRSWVVRALGLLFAL